MPASVDRGFRMLEGLRLPERYAIRRPIADGGMASVWCAHDRALGRSVAIKLLSHLFANDETAVRRFNREARAAARLSSHRNVVTIYDIGTAADEDAPRGRPFIVMEYLAGGTVADALRVGAVSHSQALQWISQSAAAIDYAHGQGVIHRDIKPVNLLLDCQRVLHVADFGIAHLATEDTFNAGGQLLGTAAYIAPEQVRGEPATEASDRYALAVAAFEMLTGSRPFPADNFTEQARQHLSEEPPRASDIDPDLPPALDAVLARGMAKRPEDRWDTATQFAAAVDEAFRAPVLAATPPRTRVAPAIPTLVVPEPSRERHQPRPRRGLALALLAAGVAGVIAAVAASGAFTPTREKSARSLAAVGHKHSARVKRVHHAAGRHTTHTKAAPAKVDTGTAQASAVEATPVAATTPAPTAETLQAQGHQELLDGNYAAAIPLLRRAASAAGPGDLTYAYALYDLGRALRLSGDPKAAVPILWRRLQIPNQTGVVRAELQLALRELGAQASGSHRHH